jgi:hypothetical protein
MANYGSFQFAPPDYGDWAQYAGLDRKTGEIQGGQPSMGVPPPEDMQGYMDQRLASTKDKLAAIPGAFQQASQGNFTKAVGMLRNPTQPTGQPQTSVFNMGYDYFHGLD